MPTEAKRWVKVHEWQLDTAKKREKMMQFYAPSDDDDDTKRGPKMMGPLIIFVNFVALGIGALINETQKPSRRKNYNS